MGADPSLSCCHRPCAGRRGAGLAGLPGAAPRVHGGHAARAITAAGRGAQPSEIYRADRRGVGRLCPQHVEDFTLPATPESARTAHGQPSPPAYARADSYTPGFPLQFPLPGQSRKTSGYGWRTDPMGGLGDDFHIGNDLAAAQGTPVLAAADGVVRMAGSHKSYGNYLRILHADGDETLYAHMQYLFVKAGECVTAGQSLGTVGETGNATGPHLHFEILHRGLRYDPAEALQNAS